MIRLVLLLINLLVVGSLIAQNNSFFDANSTAPGFSLLDKAPESINRPQDVKALSLAFTNAFTENNGLPSNFAFEVTPYWFVKNKQKNFSAYTGLYMNIDSKIESERNKFNIDKTGTKYRHDVFQNVFAKAKMVSISSAYINQYNVNDIYLYNNLSLGARSEIISVHSKITKRDFYIAYTNYQEKVQGAELKEDSILKLYYEKIVLPTISASDIIQINEFTEFSFDDLELMITNNYTDFESNKCDTILFKAFVKKIIEEVSFEYIDMARMYCNDLSQNLDNNGGSLIAQNTEEEINKLKEILERKPIFRLEAAGAVSSFFATSNFNSINFGRSGFWLTAEYNYKPYSKASRIKYISILAIERILYNPYKSDLFPDIENNTITNDLGARVILELEKFNIGMEGIWRYNITDKASTYRASGSVGYTISPKIHLTAAFGKNFGEENNIITVMGIDWKFLQSLLNIDTTNPKFD